MNLKTTLKICFIAAIEAIFCFTPLGSIPIGPIVATLAMIPVIITSLTFGKNLGMIMGFIMATFSFIVWTFIQPASVYAFLFTPFSEAAGYKGNFFSLVICFVPRTLTGFIPAFLTEKFKNLNSKNAIISETLAALIASLAHTILFLIFAFLFFARQYENVEKKTFVAILITTLFVNGTIEAIIAAIVCPQVSKAIKKI